MASKTGEVPQAQLVLSVDGVEHKASSSGAGPVDATFKAIEAIAQSQANLQLYSVNAITQGTDSQGEVTVRLEKGGRIVNGNGADTDILAASAKAYLNALNLMQAGVHKTHPQADGV
ncbi:2-isopropylmalate synthase [compost metagenome]